jgi:ParB family transcriptional regulator, chromosome partitioning protein
MIMINRTLKRQLSKITSTNGVANMIDNAVSSLPFNVLSISGMNVRLTNGERNIEALASSIESQGLLQNLVVTAGENGHEVVAGGRRYKAIALLVAQGKFPADHPVPVKIVSREASTAASTTENVARETMHPADEYAAFQRLTVEGWSIDKIADAFGVTPLVVERRLRLAQAAPSLMVEFKNDAITTDQLIALCTTEDHALQVAVWERLRVNDWQSTPDALRKAVLGTEIEACQDARVVFIGGITTYVEAGGIVRRDLFSEEGAGGIIEQDSGLLEQLVGAKLEGLASELRAEGWSWVEVWPEFDSTAFHRLGRAPKAEGALPAEEQARVDALVEESGRLQKENDELERDDRSEGRDSDDPEDRLQEIWERQEKIEEEIEEINAGWVRYAAEVMANAGALVIYEKGTARIERGMVRTADRKALAAAVGQKEAVQGGRETKPAGRKADELSDALQRSLLGHRNLAAQMETAKNTHVAKVLLACWSVQRIRATSDHSRGSAPTDLTLGQDYEGTRTRHPISDAEGLGKVNRWGKECAACVAKLPKAEEALWDVLAAMKPAELDSVIAHGVAMSVSLAATSKGLTGKLLAALDLDMAAHFTPTADNYLGRVSRTLILEGLNEAGKIKGTGDKDALTEMKKGQLAEEAEKRLADAGWVPAVIRNSKAAGAKKGQKVVASKKRKAKR